MDRQHVESWRTFPQQHRASLDAQLEHGENLLAWFRPDLDLSLQFHEGLVVLTSRRLLARVDRTRLGQSAASQPAATAPADTTPQIIDGWEVWRLDEVDSIHVDETGGLGALEAFGRHQRLAYWRYTIGRSKAARRIVRYFDAVRREGTERISEPEEQEAPLCPSCGGALPGPEEPCPTCDPESVERPAASLRRLLQFARPRRTPIIIGFLVTVASTAVGLIPPYLTMPLFDDFLIPASTGQTIDYNTFWIFLLALTGAAVLSWALDWARTHVIAWVSERISADLRNRTYAHLQNLSLEFFGGKRTGDLISRIGSDTDRICNFIAINVLDFLTDVLIIVMTAAILLSIDPMLALATLVPFPLIVALVHWIRRHLRRGYRNSGRAWGEMNNVLVDTIPGVRVVKAFAQEQREIDRFGQRNEQVVAANDGVNRVWSFVHPTIHLLNEVGWLLVFSFGAYRVVQGSISAGVLTAFLAYIGRFYGKMESMTRIAGAVQRAGAAAHRIFEILDRRPSVAEPVRPVHPGRLQGEIEFRDVGFRYGPRTVLQNVNLTIRPGEMVGLVGPSGAGKSTLINLVCRFYDVAEGSLRVDGVDIRSFPIHEYRRNIGVVLQEPFLFFGTIAENIAYGKPGATRAEIVVAARAARAHEFILKLPEAYDSMVGERGQTLSGGERQRISIARALLIDPRILILDEATSSVDTDTEREIQAALDNLIQGRTTIAIAHRLSTLRKANRLVVMERGQVAEVGHHFELLKVEGAYARLHKAQTEMAQALGT